MTAPFGCEVRFPLDDVAAFHRRLEALGARVRLAYAFTDHYYQPPGAPWDPPARALRIREHTAPEAGAEVLLTRVEIARRGGLPVKRSQFPEGKVRLYAGRLSDCRRVVEGLGFSPWITGRKRDGRLFTVPGLGALVDYLRSRGYEVPAAHVAAPDVLRREQRAAASPRDIYARDLRWLRACDLVVAEVSTPSLGVGMEVAEAQHLGKPVLALCRAGVPLSALVAGHPAIRLLTYADPDDLVRQLAAALPQEA